MIDGAERAQVVSLAGVLHGDRLHAGAAVVDFRSDEIRNRPAATMAHE